MEELDRISKEMERLGLNIDKTRQMISALTDGWGRFTEGLTIPSLDTILSSFGMKLKGTYQRVKRRRNGETMEMDILGVAEKNGKETIIAVEAKSHLRKDDVDNFISTIEEFPYFFKEYKDREIICFVAFINCERGIGKYAEKKGLYVLAPSGNIMAVLNKKDFKPHIFKTVGSKQ